MLTIETVRDADDSACADGSPFDAFVERIGKVVQRLAGSGNVAAPGSRMTFVCAPMVRRRDATGTEEVWRRVPVDMTRRVDSPWLVVDATETSPARIQITFHWSERQMMIDQANLAGYRAGQDGNGPLTPDEFRGHVAAYEEAVLLAASPEARDQAQGDIETRIPPDVLWLLRHAFQSTRGPFEGFVDDARRHVQERSVDHYCKISEIITESMFSNINNYKKYSSIDELRPTLPIDGYALQRVR